MAERKNFLLGKGESITSEVELKKGFGKKADPYTFDEAKRWLVPQLTTIGRRVSSLPQLACPRDEADFSMTIHPSYLAKSYRPIALLREFGLHANGSRRVFVVPREPGGTAKKGREQLTSKYFLTGKRSKIFEMADSIRTGELIESVKLEAVRIENLETVAPRSKLINIPETANEFPAEVVLHHEQDSIPSYISESFRSYCDSLKLEVLWEKRLAFNSVLFVPVIGIAEVFAKLAQFAYLRAVRPIRKIVPKTVTIRVFPGHLPYTVELPEDEGVVDESIRAAIFDGGVNASCPGMKRYVKTFKIPNATSPDRDFQSHGTSVTSAFLFGCLERGVKVAKPFCRVDHFRVVDDSNDPAKIYDVHRFIGRKIKTGSYQFVNLSLGPQTPIEDDDIDSWTATLDEALAGGDTLATVAVGNDGELDEQLRLNRIQPPSDAVNALGVGACDRNGSNWSRAPYSCIGLGRSPGLVKPDLVAFGGTATQPFWTLNSSRQGTRTLPTGGTSFAAPTVLRTASGIRALLGKEIQPLGLRALLVHCAENNGLPIHEIGRGRVSDNLEDFITTPDNSARILYQGEVPPGRLATRARIPLPSNLPACNVTISATICYSTEVDHNHPDHYTKAGLIVTFRPHDERFNLNEDGTRSHHSRTAPFFGKSNRFKTEQELRGDDLEWETVRHGSQTKRSSSLQNPCFDIFYNARDGGGQNRRAPVLRYAMVITISAPRVPDFYNLVVRQYGARLTVLRPTTTISIRSSS